jgi:hypothetical protein
MAHDKLQLLKELDDASARARRRTVMSAWLSVAAAAAVLGVIVFSGARRIATTNELLAGLQGKVGAEEKRLQELQQANAKLKEENEKFGRLNENYRASVAAQSEARLPPVLVAPGPVIGTQPRVYLQIVAQEDRQRAEAVGARLGTQGFRVMGIELVERAARLRNTEVRYYKKIDEAGATRLLNALQSAGESSATLLYLNLENARVRPNHYEVWFAARSGRKPEH